MKNGKYRLKLMKTKYKPQLSNLNSKVYDEFLGIVILMPSKERSIMSIIKNLHISFEQILSYYECPESCKAVCCKPCIVTFTKKEYTKALENNNYQNVLITQTKRVHKKDRCCELKSLQPFRQFDHEICPVLNENKCGIYLQRPWLCRTYPFSAQAEGWSLILCQLGVEVFLDYACSLIVCGILSIREKDTLPSHVVEWATDLANGIHDPEFIVLPQNSEMGTFIEILNNFRIYLHSLSKNYRYQIREKTLSFFEICCNEQPTENIVHEYINQVKALAIEGERETAKET